MPAFTSTARYRPEVQLYPVGFPLKVRRYSREASKGPALVFGPHERDYAKPRQPAEAHWNLVEAVSLRQGGFDHLA